MGARDASFARCNCDWPEDERCKALPDDQTRWFNHLLWLQSVRTRSSILPCSDYGVDYWSRKMALSPERIMEMIKAMAQQGLIAWTPADDLVVVGVDRNHEKLGFKVLQPDKLINPFRITSKWGVVRVSGQNGEVSGQMSGYEPVSGQMSASRVEESREEESRGEDGSHARGRDHHEPPLEPEQFELEGSKEHKPPSKQDVVNAWNVLASKKSWPKVSKIPGGKLGITLEARVKDDWWLEHFPKAISKLEVISWLETYTFERFLYADAVRKIVDGDWDDRAPRAKSNGLSQYARDKGHVEYRPVVEDESNPFYIPSIVGLEPEEAERIAAEREAAKAAEGATA